METGLSPTTKSRGSLIARSILLFSLFCSLILGSIMVFPREPFWMSVHIGFLVAVVVVWRSRGFLLRTDRLDGVMLIVAVINLVVVVPELTLRAVDFRYAPGIRGGYQRIDVGGGHITRLIPDEKLFWKVSPADVKVNALGFPYKEVAIPKPAHTYRIVFLGDSCTQQGYPDFAEVFLNGTKSQGDVHFESVSLALSGYSSHQGRVMAEEYGRRLEPDLGVVYFGWNDHWLAHGAIDANKKVHVPGTRWERTMDGMIQASRLLQGVNKMAVTLRGTRVDDFLNEVQVPPAQYRDNLLKIKAVFDDRGVPVVFITAPTAHYRLGVPDYLVENRFIVGKSESIALHKQYNQIVREVARDTGAHLLDLESEFSERSDLAQIFTSDGIHFQEEGLALVASRLTQFVRQNVLSRGSQPRED